MGIKVLTVDDDPDVRVLNMNRLNIEKAVKTVCNLVNL